RSMRCVAVWQATVISPQPAARSQSASASQGSITGYTSQQPMGNETKNVADQFDEAAFQPPAHFTKASSSKAIGFPILLGHEVFGILKLFTCTEREENKELFEMMTSIGSHIGQLIDRKRAEGALKASEEKYRTILENIQESYYEVDLAGNFVFFNDSLCDIFGYSRDELIGLNYRQYTDPYTALKIYKAAKNIYTGGESDRTYEFEIIRKDGVR